MKSQLQGDDDDDEEEEAIDKKAKRNQSGQETKKLLKKMKQEFQDSDDDEKDPYAASDGEDLSDDEESDEAEAESSTQQKPAAMEGISFGLGAPAAAAPSQSRPSSRASSPPLLLPRSKTGTIKLGKTTGMMQLLNVDVREFIGDCAVVVKSKRPHDDRSSRESSPARSASDLEPTSKKVLSTYSSCHD